MKDILIIQGARFGDLVQTKRLIMSLVREGDIHLCVDRNLGALARILFPKATTHELFFHSPPEYGEFEANLRVFGKLREAGFKHVYNCNFSPLTASICRLFPSENIIGYRPVEHSDGGIIRSPWCRLAFRMGKRRRFATLNLVDLWGWLCKTAIEPKLVNPAASGRGGGLGIVLAGRESRRSLPAPVAAQFAQILAGILDSPRIKLFGTMAEARLAKTILRYFSPAMSRRVTDLTGKTDWRRLIEELSDLDLLMTPDTGTMHLAAHLGVPVMAFFLSSAWCHETGPYGLGHIIWQSSHECSPCLESQHCANGLKCLEPYKDPTFPRCLAASVKKEDFSQISAPPGLQCWRTGFDSLGQVLEAGMGDDPYKNTRAIIRALLMGWLKIPEASGLGEQFSTQEVRGIIEDLVPAEEWMLPPGRYY